LGYIPVWDHRFSKDRLLEVYQTRYSVWQQTINGGDHIVEIGICCDQKLQRKLQEEKGSKVNYVKLEVEISKLRVTEIIGKNWRWTQKDPHGISVESARRDMCTEQWLELQQEDYSYKNLNSLRYTCIIGLNLFCMYLYILHGCTFTYIFGFLCIFIYWVIGHKFNVMCFYGNTIFLIFLYFFVQMVKMLKESTFNYIRQWISEIYIVYVLLHFVHEL
jgi:hypothetical protein